MGELGKFLLYQTMLTPARPESCLIQDEPEAGMGFSHKMSLKEKLGMLGIDSPHGRFQTDEPGADPGVSERQWGGRVSGREQSRGVRLDRGERGASGLRT